MRDMKFKNNTKNKIGRYFPNYIDAEGLDAGILETENAFSALSYSRRINWVKTHKWLTTGKLDNTFMRPALIKKRPLLEVDWQPLLFAELGRLRSEALQVSVMDFGAVADGKTDSTKAFVRAMGRGGRSVSIPEGEFIISGLKIPSNTELIGAGTTKTFLRMHDFAPKSRQGIRNRNRYLGNRSIRLEGFTLDWRAERFPEKEKSSVSGIRSSGITLCNVKFGLVRNICVRNAGLHGVDVTSAYYSYAGDGTTSRFRSRYVWIDDVEAYGFGDDGITTHHSDYVYITHSFLHDPSGRAHQKGFSNSNGIEVDDGSRHVVLHNNYTENCFGGVEIKAHETSSAAYDTQIIGHYSKRDNRAYNFRHIGHHKENDTNTLTAIGIRATFLVAEEPQNTPLYEESVPRALVVSAYQKVAIHHFCTVNQSETPVIAIQYRARYVDLAHLSYRGIAPEIKTGQGVHFVCVSPVNEWTL